jgi:predicted dehydrogenase
MGDMRVAVAGLGFMGFTHLEAFQSVPDAQVVAVVSSDPVKLTGNLTGIQGNLGTSGRQMDFSHLRKYHSVEQAILDPDIDALDICLPSDQHFPVALAALRAGKHVLVEKPLALTGESADTLVSEAELSGRILMAGQVLRFIPAYRSLAGILNDSRLGPVRSAFFRRRCAAPIWSRWLTDPSRSGGAVMDLLIHDIDFCLHLFGKPEVVSAIGHHSFARGIDVIEARLTYPSGVPVVITGGWHHPKSYPFSMEFTVVSEAGTLEFNSSGTPLTLFDAAGSSEAVVLAEHSDPSVADSFVEELRYFTECVRTESPPARCPPSESAMAVKIANWLIQSRDRHGEEIKCMD